MADDVRTEPVGLAELRRSEELNRRLLEAMPGGVVHVSADGAIRHANSEALRFLGMSYDAVTQRYTTDWEPETVFEDGSPCSVEAYPITQALMTGRAQPPVTIGVRRPSGELGWAVFTAVPVREGDRTTGAIATFVDITERRELERRLQQAQTMEAVGRLAGGIAHDFNNLLTVILGNAQSLAETLELDEDHRAELEDIGKAARHASGLTRQLLEFARKRTPQARTVYLEQLIDEVAPVLRHLLGDANELQVSHAGSKSAVEVDSGQFERVLINLCTNARDAMPDGGSLTISTHRAKEGPARHAIIRVRDTGRGMGPEELGRAFEPFFSHKFGRGSGLGLATVHSLITQAHGEIDVQSEPGRGTCFEIRLPLSTKRPSSDSDESPAGEPRLAASVLVVEDEGLVRDMVGRALTSMGYEVSLAESGEEARARFSAKSYDLVLTDVVMPGISGTELARGLRERQPELPIVFMSGYSEDMDQRGDEHTAYLAKPFAPADLRRVLSRLLRSD